MNLFTAPAFRPFQYRDFRVLSAASVLNTVGMTGEGVVLGWFVFELTDSTFMVGLVMALHLAPNFFLGVPAGALADAIDRRRLIRLLSLAMAVPPGALGLLIFLDLLELWHLLALSVFAGALLTFRQTAGASMAFDIVGHSLAIHGMTMMLMTSRLGGIVGSIGAGSVTQRLGPDVAFFAIAGVHVLSAVTTLFIQSRGQAAPVVRDSPWESLIGFTREIRRNRSLLGLGITTAALEILGFSHQVVLPSLARDVLGVGAEGLGVMSGVRSLGGIAGIAFLASQGEVARKGLLYLWVLLLFGCFLVLLGFAPGFLLTVLVLVLISAMMTLADILSQTLMQLSVPNELRGRAMGSWVLAIGLGPVGNIELGALAAVAGVTFALSVNGLALVALAAGIAAFVPRIRRM